VIQVMSVLPDVDLPLVAAPLEPPAVRRRLTQRRVRPQRLARYWPLISALVAAQFLKMAKNTIDPKLAVALIMESAIIASKIDPKTVPQSLPESAKAN
jgi:hypothetical protein